MTTAQFSLINHALNHIEQRLTAPLTAAEVAAAVSYSRFHFARLFQTILGMSLRTYLRNRRLSEAAGELLYSSKPILEIALDYQFGSQEAFSRAFKRCFGLSPDAYRRRRRSTRRFPRITPRQPRLVQPKSPLATFNKPRRIHSSDGTIVIAQLHAIQLPDKHNDAITRYWR